MRFGKWIVVGFLADLVDWVGIGFIPIIMDAFDLVMAFIWYRKIGIVGLAAAVEVIPGFDILPTNICLGYLCDQKEASP